MARIIYKMLIANRGEIASRVIRACWELGIEAVAVYSDADRNARFVKEADEAVYIGPAASESSYLNQNAIVDAAQRVGAQAIHPGYGFLAENASFAQKCQEAGFIFVGPSPETIVRMGLKIAAKQLMVAHGIPVIPGYDGAEQSTERLIEESEKIGYPVLLKASAGGGGKGMRVVYRSAGLKEAIESAQREALGAFGDDTLLLEKYFPSVRHIEFQILGDSQGNLIHCFERECSIQRRHQKIIEETPSPILTSQLRERMGEAAVKVGQILDYVGAGTVEFLLDEQQNFYFLEVNTRIQVEHPITELVTGLDLVQAQIRVAQGEPLGLEQKDIQLSGHAVECRIYAEDPANHFLPCTGQILAYRESDLPGVRYDSGVETGTGVGIHYDPLLAKLIVHAADRHTASRKMRKALSETVLLGVTTNIPFLQQILNHPAYCNGQINTHFIEAHFPSTGDEGRRTSFLDSSFVLRPSYLALAAALWRWAQREKNRTTLQNLPSGWRNNFYKPQRETFVVAQEQIDVFYRCMPNGVFESKIGEQAFQVVVLQADERSMSCTIDGHRYHWTIAETGEKLHMHSSLLGTAVLERLPRFPEAAEEDISGGYQAPMPGRVLKVLIESGATVKNGQGLVILESMKMENTICAAADGVVQEIRVTEGEMVEAGTLLLVMAEEAENE